MKRSPFQKIASFGQDIARELALLEKNIIDKFTKDDAMSMLPVEITGLKTTTYTARFGELVRCDPTAAGFTVYVPNADDKNADLIIVKNDSASANTITIKPLASGYTINGTTSTTIAAARGVARLYPCRATKDWMVL